MKQVIAALIFAFAGQTLAGIAHAEQAHVEAGVMEGQMILFIHRNACFGITPTHVMKDGLGFASLVRRTPKLLTGEATEIRTFGYDLSLISVSGGLSSKCGANFSQVSDIGDLLEKNGGKGFVQQVFSNGDSELRPIQVVSTDAIHLRLEEVGNWTIGPGDSGAAVLIDGQIAGILQRRGDPGQPATALRWDFATQLINWELERSVSTTISAPATQQDSAAILVDAPNARSLGAEYAATNLTEPTNAGKEWRVEAVDWPIDLIIGFADGPIHEIASIEIQSIPGRPDISPKNLEIQRTRTANGDGRWTSFDTIIVDPAATNRIVFPGNMRARRLRLRIYDNWGGVSEVGLSTVRLLLKAAP